MIASRSQPGNGRRGAVLAEGSAFARQQPADGPFAITADIYSHVGPAQQREAADRLDQALR